MHIHEYQAKRLLSAYGVPTPEGRLAATPGEAEQAARDLPGPVWVVKAQIHAGGRGKAGGVKGCRRPEGAREAAASLLGARLVTPQTGPDGERVNAVWIEQGTASARECYLAVALDRASQCLTVMASPGGGMDIEAVAASSPERGFSAPLGGWPYLLRQPLRRGWREATTCGLFRPGTCWRAGGWSPARRGNWPLWCGGWRPLPPKRI